MNVLYSGIIYFITIKYYDTDILQDLNNNIYLWHSMYFAVNFGHICDTRFERRQMDLLLKPWVS